MELNNPSSSNSGSKRKLVTGNSNKCQTCKSAVGVCHVHELDILDPVPSHISKNNISSHPKKLKTSSTSVLTDQQKLQKEERQKLKQFSKWKDFVTNNFSFNFHLKSTSSEVSTDFPENQKISRPKWFFSKNTWTDDKEAALDKIFRM